MNIQVKCEDGVSPVLVGITEEEYYAVPVDSGEDEEPITWAGRIITDRVLCRVEQQQLV